MFAVTGIIYIWAVGIRDYVLTRWLIDGSGSSAELNPLARWLIEASGPQALLWLKLGSMVLFTAAVLLVYRRNRVRANRLVIAGSLVSVVLSMWWDAATLLAL